VSNAAHHRTISRLPRIDGGPPRRKVHRRKLAAVQRQMWDMGRAAQAELDLLPEDDAEDIVMPPKLVWGWGMGPKQVATLAEESEWSAAVDPA